MLKKTLLALALGGALLMADSGWTDSPLDALKVRAQAGDVLAQRQLGLAYLDAASGHTDTHQGETWLAEAARQGDAEAAFQLAQHFARQVGQGRQINLQARQKQAQYLKQATLAGHAAATTALAELLLDRAMDADVPDHKRQRALADAEALLRHAADHGHVPAMRALAERLGSGRGLPADPVEALRYLQNAASAHDAEAQYQLALHYRNAQAPDHSESRADVWLQKAAEAHHPAALAEWAETRLQAAERQGNPDLASTWVALAQQLQLSTAPRLQERLEQLQSELASSLTQVDRDWPEPALVDTEALVGSDASIDLSVPADLDASLLTDPVLARFSEQINALEQRLNEMSAASESLQQQLRDKDQQIAALTTERDAAVAAKQAAEAQVLAWRSGSAGSLPAAAHAAEQAPMPLQTESARMADASLSQQPTTRAPAVPDPAAQTLYQQGLNLLRDAHYQDARRAFERAAKTGHAGALNNLGLMQVRGLGGAANIAAGMASLVRAANAGSIGAAESLAAMYDYGIGVRPDRALAIEYYRMAAARGSDKAQAGLQRLGVASQQISAR